MSMFKRISTIPLASRGTAPRAIPRARFASTTPPPPTPSPTPAPLPAPAPAPASGRGTGRRWFSTTLLVAGTGLAVAYYYDSRSLAHEHVVMPLVRALADPEEGHKLAVTVLGLPSWARPRDMGVDGDELRAEIFGMPLVNPVGVAAGFDKDAQAIDGLFDLGFGYVEVGSITPVPQPGNPKPRFFRLEEDDAAINRYGFNSLGHGQALGQLRARLVAFSQSHPSLFPSPLPANPLPPAGLPRSLRPGHVLAVNLGKNKTSAADSNEDYIRGVRVLGPYADVVVINVSSPNTPGLRALQGRDILVRLLSDVVAERDRIADKATGLPKLAVKVACDLSEDELADVASAVRTAGVDGVIISNTTLRREGLVSEHKDQIGGLSGRPLFPYALDALRTLRPLLPPTIPIIGAGGIWTGDDALTMARAGASIVQVYTAFGYRGVGTPRLVKDEITYALAMRADATWREEVGREVPVKDWDEKRVEKEGEALRREAEGLGELLRHIKEKEEIQNLANEAEEALSRAAAAVKAESQSPPEPTPTPAPTPALIASSESAVEPSTEPPATLLIEAVADIPEIVLVPTTPVTPVVIPVDVTPSPTKGDEWTERVRDGPRRLV